MELATNNNGKPIATEETGFVEDIKQIVNNGLRLAYQGVNMIMVQTYWQVGQRIVEEEQNGEARAEYGVQLINMLSVELSKSYSKGFTARDLRAYRQFYLYFKDLEIWHSRVPNLTWTHFKMLLRVSDEDARYWYMNEASQEYLTFMPTEEQLRHEIEQQKELFLLNQQNNNQQ